MALFGYWFGLGFGPLSCELGHGPGIWTCLGMIWVLFGLGLLFLVGQPTTGLEVSGF